MSRYNNSNTQSGSTNNDGDFDDTTLKLQNYAAIRFSPDNLNAASHDQYGTSFISNFNDAEVIDGIVLQRDDKPGTWKIFSAGKFFNLNPQDGLVYEQFSEDDGYSGEMSADDILSHPRVAGFSETFGGNDYFYTPVGVVIEEANDIATNDDVEVETTDAPSIDVGDASMLLSNKTWTRTFAKKMSTMGDSIINDDGTYGGDSDNPKYDAHRWLATEDPTLRSELEGRSLELWITEEEMETEDGETQAYDTPNLMDVKTGNFVTIDNGISNGNDGASTSTDKAAATDGGAKTDTTTNTTDTTTTESPDEPSTSSDDSGLPENVPDKLNDLIDYMARNGETSADEMRSFAEDEVDDPDSIDWEAAANAANERAE